MAVFARLGHEVQDDFTVHRGLENGTASLKFLAKFGGVSVVAVNLVGGAVKPNVTVSDASLPSRSSSSRVTDLLSHSVSS